MPCSYLGKEGSRRCNSMCKGPEAQWCLVGDRNSKDAGSGCSQRRLWAEDHIREATGRDSRGEEWRALQTIYCKSFALSELRVTSGC